MVKISLHLGVALLLPAIIMGIVGGYLKSPTPESLPNPITTTSNRPTNSTLPGPALNAGISEESMQSLLREIVATNRELLTRYPEGYVLFAQAGGRIIHEPQIGSVYLDVDWSQATITLDEASQLAFLNLPHLQFVYGEQRLSPRAATHHIPYVENKPTRTTWFNADGMSLYCEVLDANKGVFLMGFRKE